MGFVLVVEQIRKEENTDNMFTICKVEGDIKVGDEVYAKDTDSGVTKTSVCLINTLQGERIYEAHNEKVLIGFTSGKDYMVPGMIMGNSIDKVQDVVYERTRSGMVGRKQKGTAEVILAGGVGIVVLTSLFLFPKDGILAVYGQLIMPVALVFYLANRLVAYFNRRIEKKPTRSLLYKMLCGGLMALCVIGGGIMVRDAAKDIVEGPRVEYVNLQYNSITESGKGFTKKYYVSINEKNVSFGLNAYGDVHKCVGKSTTKVSYYYHTRILNSIN